MARASRRKSNSKKTNRKSYRRNNSKKQSNRNNRKSMKKSRQSRSKRQSQRGGGCEARPKYTESAGCAIYNDKAACNNNKLCNWV